jgi:hypothetical protein
VQGLLFIACCFLLFLFVPVLLFLLTYVFRQACVLCGLRKPSVLGAAGIMLVTVVSVGVAESVMGEIVRLTGEQAGLPRWESGIVTFFLALPIDLVISAAIHAGLMGIRFGKGIEVWFVQRLIYLALIAAAVFVAAVVYLIQTMNG